MSLMDKVKEAAMNQFVEVIEWLDNSQDTLLYRFPVYQQEIKNGAQLIVRESQAAVFVFEGQVADVFTPGRYTVEGGNTPILSKLGAWKHGADWINVLALGVQRSAVEFLDRLHLRFGQAFRGDF